MRKSGIGIELSDFEVLEAVGIHGSFRKAARSLQVRQSSVSRCIKKMEGVLGTSLFDRSASGVRCTAAGVRLFGYASRMLELARNAVVDVGAVGGGPGYTSVDAELRPTDRLGAGPHGRAEMVDSPEIVATVMFGSEADAWKAPPSNHLMLTIALRRGC